MSPSLHPYARPAYAAALASADVHPVSVDAWRTPVLSRPIVGGGRDAIGPYPMTVLAADMDLEAGLEALAAAELVSVVMVADPIGYTPSPDIFDLVRPFKTHHLVRPAAYAPSKHHRAEIRRSLARCVVEPVSLGNEFDVWERLYRGLVERHAITGLTDFPTGYFRTLAAMPEIVALAARVEGEIVAMGLWFAYEGAAYNHLGASSAAGYAVGASYALYDAAITHFGDCKVINLGGGAGTGNDQADGLARFKRGFANDTATAHLYGKVLDRARYAALGGDAASGYFPAYRAPGALHRRETAAPIRAMSASS